MGRSGLDRIQYFRIKTGLRRKNFAVRSPVSRRDEYARLWIWKWTLILGIFSFLKDLDGIWIL